MSSLPSFVRFLTNASESEGETDARDNRVAQISEGKLESKKKGEPGSRKHRRFLNSTLSDYETDGQESDEEEPIVKLEWKSHFTEVGTEFFSSASPTMGKPPKTKVERSDAAGAFLKLQRHVRRELRRTNLLFIKELEDVFIPYKMKDEVASTPSYFQILQSSSEKEQKIGSLLIVLEGSHQRFIAHAVAKFHQLTSGSHTNKMGFRVTKVSRSTRVKPHGFSLYDYLVLTKNTQSTFSRKTSQFE